MVGAHAQLTGEKHYLLNYMLEGVQAELTRRGQLQDLPQQLWKEGDYTYLSYSGSTPLINFSSYIKFS